MTFAELTTAITLTAEAHLRFPTKQTFDREERIHIQRNYIRRQVAAHNERMAMAKLQWKRADDKYVETVDARYQIEPQYNHGTRPFGYTVYYAPEGNAAKRVKIPRAAFTQHDGKEIAQHHADKLAAQH